MKLISIILLPFIIGCAGTVDLKRDKNGRIEKITAHGNISTEIDDKKNQETIKVDNKTDWPTKEIVSVTGQRVLK